MAAEAVAGNIFLNYTFDVHEQLFSELLCKIFANDDNLCGRKSSLSFIKAVIKLIII